MVLPRGLSEEHQYINYLLGMTPSRLHMPNLIDPSRVDLRGHRGPSTIAGCQLCAANASVETIKLLLGRGRVWGVPYYHILMHSAVIGSSGNYGTAMAA